MSQKDINKVLNMNYWPTKLETMEPYFVSHDDNNGDETKGLQVTISPDGDAWVKTHCPINESCRFRMPGIGGGRCPKIRNALLVLAEAIRQEREEI